MKYTNRISILTILLTLISFTSCKKVEQEIVYETQVIQKANKIKSLEEMGQEELMTEKENLEMEISSQEVCQRFSKICFRQLANKTESIKKYQQVLLLLNATQDTDKLETYKKELMKLRTSIELQSPVNDRYFILDIKDQLDTLKEYNFCDLKNYHCNIEFSLETFEDIENAWDGVDDSLSAMVELNKLIKDLHNINSFKVDDIEIDVKKFNQFYKELNKQIQNYKTKQYRDLLQQTKEELAQHYNVNHKIFSIYQDMIYSYEDLISSLISKRVVTNFLTHEGIQKIIEAKVQLGKLDGIILAKDTDKEISTRGNFIIFNPIFNLEVEEYRKKNQRNLQIDYNNIQAKGICDFTTTSCELLDLPFNNSLRTKRVVWKVLGTLDRLDDLREQFNSKYYGDRIKLEDMTITSSQIESMIEQIHQKVSRVREEEYLNTKSQLSDLLGHSTMTFKQEVTKRKPLVSSFVKRVFFSQYLNKEALNQIKTFLKDHPGMLSAPIKRFIITDDTDSEITLKEGTLYFNPF